MLRVLFYLCVAALALGQFSSISKSGPANIYVFDLLVGIFALTGTSYFLIKRSFKIDLFHGFLFVFGLVAALSLFIRFEQLTGSQMLVSASYLVRFVSYLFAGITVYNMVKNRLISSDEILKAFIYSGLMLAVLGFIQLAVFPDFEQLDPSLGWDPHKNRLASTFFDPNFAGMYLVIVLIFHINRAGKTNKFLWAFYAAILFLSILLTFSRSAWAALAVVVMIYGIFRYRILLLASLLVAFSAYYFVPRVQTRISGTTDPADSAQFRFISWKNAYEIASDNLLTGVGFNSYRYVQLEYGFLTPDSEESHSGSGSDSSLLLIIATTGIIGLGVFLSSFIFINSWDLTKLALFVSLFLESQFINSLFYPQILFLWMAVSTLNLKEKEA
jgi:O-antigen ligase